MNFISKVCSPFVYAYYNKMYSKYDYFEYDKLTKWYYNVPQIGFRSMNMLYGNHRCVEKALGRPLNHDAELIEHAVFFDSNLPDVGIKKTKKVITTSNYRKRLIEDYFSQYNFPADVVAIGAYIKYAENYLSTEQLSAIKQKYGKILLVMPSHSIDGVDVQYEKCAFQEEIDRISKEFDTVFICLYWKDILKGDALFYKQKGYIVVCNGMRSDPLFMSRQRDLIELADMCMSNTIGSYIGYSIVLNKPFYFFPQALKVALDKKNQSQIDQFLRDDLLINEFYKKFGVYSLDITESQKCLIDKYWGL